MSKTQIVNRLHLESLLANRGWTQDRWEHFRKGDRRFKFQPGTVRYETKCSAGWVMHRSWYYRDIDFDAVEEILDMTDQLAALYGQPVLV